MPKPPFRLGRIGKANIGCAIVIGLGLYSFVLARNQVDNRRYEIMKSKQRMKESNFGDYEVPSQRQFK
jgi:hypothetical protein